MHQFRVRKIVINVPEVSSAAAVRFWAAALGASPVAEDDPSSTALIGGSTGAQVFVQEFDGPERYDLEIETDDLAAEVDRLRNDRATLISTGQQGCILVTSRGDLIRIVPTAEA